MDITNYLTECVNENKPVSFLKFGDGEYNCVFLNWYGSNCDADTYTNKLSYHLHNSFKYLVNNTDNTYIGLWHNSENKSRWNTLVDKQINWVDYHTIIFDKTNDHKKVDLYRAIQNSKSKKIIVCNELLIKSKLLLNADHIVVVPFNNWFDSQFDRILEEVKSYIGNDKNHIVITCCGMSAKVLIAELNKCFSTGIYLDFGSALDLICTRRDSRGHKYDYNYVENLLLELLPNDWNDPKFDHIYPEAKHKLGIHLPS